VKRGGFAATLGLARISAEECVPTSWIGSQGRLVLVTVLEFWPDYGSGPLWTEEGQAANLRSLGLPEEVVKQLQDWNTAYGEEKIPIDGHGDPVWLAEGVRLLNRVRNALGRAFEVVVTGPWWEADPT
jgi:hypothetical protein